jgi:hypothetical protein
LKPITLAIPASVTHTIPVGPNATFCGAPSCWVRSLPQPYMDRTHSIPRVSAVFDTWPTGSKTLMRKTKVARSSTTRTMSATASARRVRTSLS